MNDQMFVISETFAKQLLSYLLAKPMHEVEPLVVQLRELRQANVVQEVVAGE